MTDKIVNSTVASTVLAHKMGLGLNLFDPISRAGSQTNHMEERQVGEIVAHKTGLVEAQAGLLEDPKQAVDFSRITLNHYRYFQVLRSMFYTTCIAARQDRNQPS